MNIEHTDENTVDFVEEAAMTFMMIQTHRLNEALKVRGISDQNSRQDICSDFIFDLAYGVDAGWFIEGGVRLYPKVCMAERAAAGDGGDLGAIQRLHVPTTASLWHEFAASIVDQYFNEYGETLQDVRAGSYDIEN